MPNAVQVKDDHRERVLATKIADESAACVLKSHLNMYDRDGHRWLAPDSADPDSYQAVREALEYLTLRNAIVNHPKVSGLMRVQF